MEEELAQLIYDYSKNKKTFDTFFINESIKIMIKFYNLQNFVKNIKPLSHKKSYGRYNQISKTIYINYRLINKHLNDSILSPISNYKEPFSYKYIVIMHILLHKILHAKQIQIINNIVNYNDAESFILYEEFNVLRDISKRIKNGETGFFKGYTQAINFRKTYLSLYEFSPAERLANIDSTKIVSNIASVLNDEETSLEMLQKHFEYHLIGYNIGMYNDGSNEPTKYYLDSIGENKNWDNIVELSHNLTPIEKIRLGLMVNQEELYKVSTMSHRLILTLEK